MQKSRGGSGYLYVTGCPRPWVYNIIFHPGTKGLMPTFDFHSRYGLFTYSQCNGLDPHDVVVHFASLEAECIIGRENHADGGSHLHAFVDFGRKRRFRRHVFADVGQFHPNIAPSRGTPATAYDYAIKDGDVVGGGLERPDSGRTSRGRNGETESTMATLVRIDDEQTFWDTCRELAPGLLLRCHSSLESYAKRRFAKTVQQYCHPRELVFIDERISELVEWRENNLDNTSIRGRLVRRYQSGGPPGPPGGAKVSAAPTPLLLRVYRSWFRECADRTADEKALSYTELLGLARQCGLGA